MRRLIKAALPMVVLAVGIVISMVLLATGPEAKRRPVEPVVPVVEVLTVSPQSYAMKVESQGVVSPRTQSTLVSEVAGRIVWVASNLRNGGFFEAGIPLLHIDPSDYENAITIAEAELARSQLLLAQEQGLAVYVQRDLEELGVFQDSAALARREPQLKSAKADMSAAEARLRQARTNLARSRVMTPYAGRVLKKEVDVGQYVSPGSLLATIYAVDYVEIRLPLSDSQLFFVDLPEHFRSVPDTVSTPHVSIQAQIGMEQYTWQGRIVRTEGAIDTASRQLFVVALVNDPYDHQEQRPPLKVGQFVTAEIEGKTLDGVYVLPWVAVDDDGWVLVIGSDNRIERRRVNVVYREGERLIVDQGLRPGERISVTPLPFATQGAQVQIHNGGERHVHVPPGNSGA